VALQYRSHGKEQKLSFGSYPETSLKEARLRRDEARVEIGRGGDPARRRRQAKIEAVIRAGDTFEMVACEYVGKCEAEEFATARLHDRALEQQKARAWWLPLAAGGLSFLGAVVGSWIG
jgi:hypothetical protein